MKGQCPRPLDEGDGFGGARQDRTADLYNAIVALSQLSYGPESRRRLMCLPAVLRSELSDKFVAISIRYRSRLEGAQVTSAEPLLSS